MGNPREWWVSGWKRDEYHLNENSVITVFLTLKNPNKAEAFKVVDADELDRRAQPMGLFAEIDTLRAQLAAVTKERDELFKQLNEPFSRNDSADATAYAINGQLKRDLDAAIARAEGAEAELKKLLEDSECGDCLEIGNRMENTFVKRIKELQSHADKLAAALDEIVQICKDEKRCGDHLWKCASRALAAWKEFCGKPE